MVRRQYDLSWGFLISWFSPSAQNLRFQSRAFFCLPALSPVTPLSSIPKNASLSSLHLSILGFIINLSCQRSQYSHQATSTGYNSSIATLGEAEFLTTCRMFLWEPPSRWPNDSLFRLWTRWRREQRHWLLGNTWNEGERRWHEARFTDLRESQSCEKNGCKMEISPSPQRMTGPSVIVSRTYVPRIFMLETQTNVWTGIRSFGDQGNFV